MGAGDCGWLMLGWKEDEQGAAGWRGDSERRRLEDDGGGAWRRGLGAAGWKGLCLLMCPSLGGAGGGGGGGGYGGWVTRHG